MKAHKPDYILIIIIFALAIAGLAILSSASLVISQELFQESYHYFKHQLLYGFFLGLIVFLILQKIHYSKWQKIAFPLILFTIFLLALVFVPKLGHSHGGAQRWIDLGFISLQPFEFAKLSLILYLSAILSQTGKETIKKSSIPALIVVAIIAILVLLQPDTSGVIIIFLITFIIYFLAKTKMKYLLGGAGLLFVLFCVLIKISPYRMNRIMVYFNSEIDTQGIGYQMKQAILAIGSGGLFGKGLGAHGVQKWGYLPETIGDSIFAILAEEVGFAGAALLVILFIALVWRGIKIAKNSPDKFSFLIASGITSWFFLQASINISAICGLIPLTGMPLPFISYGGSALLSCLAACGILVNISKYTKQS